MTIHVDFELAEVFVRLDVVLLFVGLHTALKAVVCRSGFRGDAHVVVVQELEALDVVLEATVSKLGHIYLVRQPELLHVG